MSRGRNLLLAAVACIIAGGFGLAFTEHLGPLRGLYCSVGTATTAGCDVTAVLPWARVVTASLMLVAVPLLAAGFAEVTAKRVHARMSGHLAAELADLRDKVRQDSAALHTALQHRLDRHHDELLGRMDVQHEATNARLHQGFGQVIAQADANAQRAADTQVRAGAGSNPAESGLAAEGAKVPPAAARKVPRPRKGEPS